MEWAGREYVTGSTQVTPGFERLHASYAAHVINELYVLATCLQRAYAVRSPCDCHVIIRIPYLYVLLTYGVLTRML